MSRARSHRSAQGTVHVRMFRGDWHMPALKINYRPGCVTERIESSAIKSDIGCMVYWRYVRTTCAVYERYKSSVWSDMVGYSRIWSDIVGHCRTLVGIGGYCRILSDNIFWLSCCILWYISGIRMCYICGRWALGTIALRSGTSFVTSGTISPSKAGKPEFGTTIWRIIYFRDPYERDFRKYTQSHVPHYLQV